MTVVAHQVRSSPDMRVLMVPLNAGPFVQIAKLGRSSALEISLFNEELFLLLFLHHIFHNLMWREA